MASSESAPAVAMVTIKANYDGEHHRFKLPLRDMVPAVFEDKVRRALRITVDQVCIIERYSDSASAFLILDRANISVYKQLYRAAKAKSKLKIRVTMIQTTVQQPSVIEEPLTITTAEPAQQPQEFATSPINHTADRSVMTDPYLRSMAPPVCPYAGSTLEYRVCCNSCERTIPDVHYHCNKCDDDDFDLCLACVESGITCYSPDHWLIKRFKKDGVFVSSTTETLAPSKLVKKESEPPAAQPVAEKTAVPVIPAPKTEAVPVPVPQAMYRTCNSCVRERPEHVFVHCTTCYDFDLCSTCFSLDAHGHHPKHEFKPAVENARLSDAVVAKLGAGRNLTHHAICDKCDKFIRGVRHKCLDCPDWDYCGECIKDASTDHAGHRFAPIYESLTHTGPMRSSFHPIHEGICCDGPSASPTLSTTGVDRNGKELPMMGDAISPPTTRLSSNATSRREPTISSPRAVINVEPSEPEPAPAAHQEKAIVKEVQGSEQAEKAQETPAKPERTPEKLDSTWVLRNSGDVAWPAGCAVKFVGGDYMGHVDSNHPAGISELVSASESTVCYDTLEPGKDYPFTVRAPVSQESQPAAFHKQETRQPEPVVDSSQVVFPKLDKESPVSSIHQESNKEAESEEQAPLSPREVEFDDLEGEVWDGSDEGFLTDEEYDILDASDEEYHEDQKQKALLRR
ncbi:unnamed protein product [Parascedosporium putredinis]|uniref:ZZ-type domain-containing protein n=1 Tax=Parascedosporium putredinis TaxID=1442378 RepID=A0A9P1H3L0_9PEZI|nr:unnamed protein product [Parascedosporium putredinis]CAI7995951.1 unnamed protein product [Parascedosporium putredinis]